MHPLCSGSHTAPNSVSTRLAYLEQNTLHDLKSPLKVHVIAHTFGLPAEHGCVRPEACFKFPFGQEINPDDLQCSMAQAQKCKISMSPLVAISWYTPPAHQPVDCSECDASLPMYAAGPDRMA